MLRPLLLLLPFAISTAVAQAPAGDPTIPVGLNMTANSPTSITLGWFRPKGGDAKEYTLYSGESATGPFNRVKSVTERTVTVDNLKPGSTYYYRVSGNGPTGESPQTTTLPAFTIAPWQPAPFPVKIAKNMCVSLGSEVISNEKPLSGTLANLSDGSDATGCRLRKNCEIKIKLDPNISVADAEYLLVHFRADCGQADWSNDKQRRTFRDYIVLGSADSTNGTDGAWQELAQGTNEQLDGVIRIPNNKYKWIAVRSSYQGKDVPAASDRRLDPSDLILCRLDVFRAPPAGYRNDYWIFTGDSLVVQDMPGGAFKDRTSFFSDLIRKQHPDRYPIVVHAARGGEMLKDTLPRTQKALSVLSPDNGTATPTATIVCWESGYNNVGVGGSLGLGASMIKSYEEAMNMCKSKGLVFVPVRIEYSLQYLNPETLEPSGSVFVNSLAVNLGGVDVFARTHAPYAVDPKTNMPYADYWTYTRQNFATALVKDGVHHTAAGADGINQLWARVADKMIYTPQAGAK